MTTNQHSIEEVILGIGEDVFNAIRKKDIESLGAFLTDDFVHRTPDGSESGKEDFLRGISAMPVEVESITGEHQRVDVFGEVVVLTGVQSAAWRQDEDVKGISLVAFTDVFVKRDGRWLIALAYGVDIES